MNNLFFASIGYAFMRKLPALKKTGKEIGVYVGFLFVIGMAILTYHSAWVPQGTHTLVEKQIISDKHCWFVFEQGGTQKRVLSHDPGSVSIGTQKNIKASLVNRGVYKMM